MMCKGTDSGSFELDICATTFINSQTIAESVYLSPFKGTGTWHIHVVISSVLHHVIFHGVL